jgi:murein DD-endopeptidase MepM/ murein hydrolase activator NlpD
VKSSLHKISDAFRLSPRKALVMKIGVGLLSSAILSQISFNASTNNSFVPTTQYDLSAFPVKPRTIKYGIALDSFFVEKKKIVQGETFSTILADYKIDISSINRLVAQSKGVFDIRNFRVGKFLTILRTSEDAPIDRIIYEPDVKSYITFNVKDKTIHKEELPVETKLRSAGGVITSSLWQTLEDNDMDYELASSMEDALEHVVDFHHTQKNDEFKLLFEQNYVAGKPISSGKLLGAYYKTGGKDHYAIYYEKGTQKGFFDIEGRPMKEGFLKSPLKFFRISSGFSMSRFHPVLRYTRPHFGTDYAAPTGTPIYAVADGTVMEAARTGGNGNYVKLKHSNDIQTQYLHMSRHAEGMRPGKSIQQGTVIGYVGSTGLATGPHVCFRFWKGGKQVNHLALNLPEASPMNKGELKYFIPVRDQVIQQLKEVAVVTTKVDKANP